MTRLFLIFLIFGTLLAEAALPFCQLVNGESGSPPSLARYVGKSGFVYDTSASLRPLGPGEKYEGQTYGAGFVQDAIQRYLPTKNFNDGVLDIFVGVRVGDPDPVADRHRVYEVATFFGAEGREIRGMARNPEAKRSLRIFVLSAYENSGKVPEEYLQLAADLSKEFGVDVAVSTDFDSLAWMVYPAPE